MTTASTMAAGHAASGRSGDSAQQGSRGQNNGDPDVPPARRRRTTVLEAVLELPAQAADLTPGGGELGRYDRHPVDVLYGFLQAAGGAAPISQARAALDSKGLGPHFSTVVDFWTSSNILVTQQDHLRLIITDRVTPDSPITPAQWISMTPSAAARSQPPRQRPAMARLSLFDGTGFARVAVDTALHTLGPAAPQLVSSAFSEIQTRLGRAVQQLWAQRATLSGGPQTVPSRRRLGPSEARPVAHPCTTS